MKYKLLIQEMLEEVLVFDIETSSTKDGQQLNIKNNFKEYVDNAVVKWFGAYSYKYNKYYELNAFTDREEIISLLSEHKVLVGFNNKNFDYPIIQNNQFLTKKYYTNLDVMKILGFDSYSFDFKNRAIYMGVKLKPVFINNKKFGKNSLQAMAHCFNLDVIKGDINYEVFYSNQWSEKETEEIKKYLHSDVEITKKLFDKLIDFWSLFTDWLNEKDVKNWVWITSSIASLTYLCACKTIGKEPSYGNRGEDEEMGGRAIVPPQEETFGAHYLDEVSKYPHIFSEFNLFCEVIVNGHSEEDIKKLVDAGKLFHGNEKFKLKGYYDIRKHGVLEKDIINKLKTRFAIKKILKEYSKNNIREIKVPELLKDVIPNNILTDDILKTLNGLQYAIKIFANALYGAARSAIFEQIYSPSAGYDCCWIGQQIHKYVQDFFEEKGFKIIGGFTDSWFIENKNISKEDIIKLARECMDDLKKYMPFPEETHQIDYECYIDYILYSYDDKKGEFKKNNYAFISDGKIKIVGLPIMKSNASKLSLIIFNKYLKVEAIKKNSLKFKKSYINELIKKELQEDISLAAVNFSCNDYNTYKNHSQIQAQISAAYLNGLSGNIEVIKNKKIGGVGIGNKYCSIKEAKDNNLHYNDLILDKVWNELEPFIEAEKKLDLSEWGF